MLRAIADEGYDQPTPIQQRAIPVVLSGRDVLAAAQTGTGKTAAFVLPILDRLASRGHPAPIRAYGARTLILTPTRELAAQIHESVCAYGRHLKLRSTVVYGGVGMHNQVQALRRGVDVLVATPGRLLDHHGQKTVDLRGVEILVLDEADRMLDMGFIQSIRRILSLLPKTRQNLLFSATFSPEIRELAGGLLQDPATVEAPRVQTTAALIDQAVHYVDEGRKRELLAHLIETGEWNQVLVFTRTKHRANRLAEQLDKEGISADAIHGNKSQGARTRALADFKANRVRVLVATDIAARGIDIEELPHVVNFDLPHVPEDYVHRIGRTGRAGSSGAAVSLVSAEDRGNLAAIEKLVKTTIAVQEVPGFTIDPSRMARASAPAREAQRRPQRPQRPSRPSTRHAKAQPARGGRGGQGRRG